MGNKKDARSSRNAQRSKYSGETKARKGKRRSAEDKLRDQDARLTRLAIRDIGIGRSQMPKNGMHARANITLSINSNDTKAHRIQVEPTDAPQVDAMVDMLWSLVKGYKRRRAIKL